MKAITTIFILSIFMTSFSQSTDMKSLIEITRDNASIAYTIKGDGDTTLFFVHGSFNDQSYWNDQVKYFEKNYKVVTIDLPGQGKSGKERKDWSIEGFAEDVVKVAGELNLKNIILIGHSLGAEVSLMAITKYKLSVVGFIAVEYFKNAATPMPAEMKKQSEAITEKLKTHFRDANEEFARTALLTKNTPESITGRVVKDYRNGYQPMGIATTVELLNIAPKEQKFLSLLKIKLYLINVNYSKTNEEPLKKYAGSGYQLLTMDGTSHFPMLEHPDELNAHIDKVLKLIYKKF